MALQIEGIAPAGRGGHCCCTVNDKVIVFGGANRVPTPYGDLYSLELGALTTVSALGNECRQHLQLGT